MYTPENIEELLPNHIFVFGSNILGNHAGGAARIALDKFWAIRWQWEWIQWQSYAFPTLDENMDIYSLDKILIFLRNLILTAEEYNDKTFLVTKVGCWIAWYEEEFMKAVFRHYKLPDNIIKPKWW